MAKSTLSHLTAIVSLLAALSLGFYDAGDATVPKTLPAYVPTLPHHLLPTTYEPWTKARPSLITAVAPSMALMGHGNPNPRIQRPLQQPSGSWTSTRTWSIQKGRLRQRSHLCRPASSVIVMVVRAPLPTRSMVPASHRPHARPYRTQ